MPYIIPLDCVNLLRASSYFRIFFSYAYHSTNLAKARSRTGKRGTDILIRITVFIFLKAKNKIHYFSLLKKCLSKLEAFPLLNFSHQTLVEKIILYAVFV